MVTLCLLCILAIVALLTILLGLSYILIAGAGVWLIVGFIACEVLFIVLIVKLFKKRKSNNNSDQ